MYQKSKLIGMPLKYPSSVFPPEKVGLVGDVKAVKVPDVEVNV
jgi:hypothetical protein